ncbi:MAG: aminotransferase class III-fold pyridoxal phosphate-dependent enzyme [Xanthomonadales bacterium]|nr:aminotransferase class III-fold pyridoxal phosphate-dependent enzyme [Xanthomonadales bacterium]
MKAVLLYSFAAAASVWLLHRIYRRLQLSLAKHPSLAGHSRMAQRVAGWLPMLAYDERQFFRADDPPEEIAVQRERSLNRLGAEYAARFPRTTALTAQCTPGVSDLQFTARYRVPFQFSPIVRERLKAGSFAASAEGVTVTDLDGNRCYDLTGSYGVNLLGIDVYKACIAEAVDLVGDLGPVLGSYHPLLASNVARLRQISGQDEVSFHMSGTEAVMQAVRLARYHTGRSHLVRFCGAYHGWWGEVQPGVGNPVRERATYTLKDMDEATLRVLRTRRDIACVLVNPLQALHPNANAPSDSTLVDSSRSAQFQHEAYTTWLQRLAEVCRARGIVLILDEVFVGFRLAPGGAQAYFNLRADMVAYGKTLGGGLPVGVLCGRHELMARYREKHPADICFARGTFNSHPYVMGAMHAFLQRLDEPATQALYEDLDARWNARAMQLNRRLAEAQLPLRVANLSTIWTICYTRPSRYNWMLQFYLRLHGLALSWVGSGRLIFSLNYTDADFTAVCDRLLAAAQQMRDDGWWWRNPQLDNRAIRRRVLRELLSQAFARASGQSTRPAAAAAAPGDRA